MPHAAPASASSPAPALHLSGTRWPLATIAEMATRVADYSVQTVAASYGLTPKQLSGVLRRHGIAIRELQRNREARSRGGRMSAKGKHGDSGLPGHNVCRAGYGAAAIEALPDNGCRWPLGDPREEGFSFCGRNRAGGRSYCSSHSAHAYEEPIAYTPKQSAAIASGYSRERGDMAMEFKLFERIGSLGDAGAASAVPSLCGGECGL